MKSIHLAIKAQDNRNEMHFNVQLHTRAQVYRNRKAYTRKVKHKNKIGYWRPAQTWYNNNIREVKNMFQVQIRFGNQWQAHADKWSKPETAQLKAKVIARRYPNHAVRVVKVAA